MYFRIDHAYDHTGHARFDVWIGTTAAALTGEATTSFTECESAHGYITGTLRATHVRHSA